MGFAFAFGWTPCIGPILTTVLAIAAASDKIARGVLLLAVYSAGLAIPFLLTALGISRFMVFYKNFRKYLHAVELFSGALLPFIGGLVFVNKLTWLASKLDFLNSAVRWLEHALTTGSGAKVFWLICLAIVVAIALWAVAKNWGAIAAMPGKKTVLMVAVVLALIVTTVYVDHITRLPSSTASGTVRADANASPAPEVTFKNLDGKEVPLGEYRGKVVLVNFWATWCEPCQIEIPWLIEMQQKYSSKGFTILGVDVDDEDNKVVLGYLSKERFMVNGQKLPMNYPVLRGDDAVADKFGGLLGYPTSFLISRDGKIVKRVQGLISYDEIAQAIESQLKTD
jgi:thiol-disulfide isomerase/thioredoxin